MVLRTMNCPTLLVFIRDSCVSPSLCASANSLYISVRMRKQALYFCVHAQTGPIFLCARTNRPYISVCMRKQALYFCAHGQTGPIFLCARANRPHISGRTRKQALYCWAHAQTDPIFLCACKQALYFCAHV